LFNALNITPSFLPSCFPYKNFFISVPQYLCRKFSHTNSPPTVSIQWKPFVAMADPNPNSDATNSPSTRLDRADWLSFGVTTLLALSIYLFTLAPEVEPGWSGILTTGAMYGGVGPPPGYAAWTIYSWLFIHLIPFSNPAWRVAVGSAVAGAVSCGLVALMVSRGGKLAIGEMASSKSSASLEKNLIRGMSGYAAGLALGFSDFFWNEALIPDFGMFTVFLFTGILFLLMRGTETNRRYYCGLAFLLFGLLLTNSQEMITALPGIAGAILLIRPQVGRDLCLILLPIAALVTIPTQFSIWDSLDYLLHWPFNWPMLVAFLIPFSAAAILIIKTRRVGTEWKIALAATACFLLGFALYLYLPIVSSTNPPVNWGYSHTLEGFFHLVGRQQYEHIIPTGSISMYNIQLWALIKQTGKAFGWPYLVFVALPVCFFPWLSVAGKKWIGSLFLISICVGPLLEELFNFSTQRQTQEFAEPYFFPLRVLLALFIGMGLILFGMKISTLGRDTVDR
jgi:hypothetical protein